MTVSVTSDQLLKPISDGPLILPFSGDQTAHFYRSPRETSRALGIGRTQQTKQRNLKQEFLDLNTQSDAPSWGPAVYVCTFCLTNQQIWPPRRILNSSYILNISVRSPSLRQHDRPGAPVSFWWCVTKYHQRCGQAAVYCFSNPPELSGDFRNTFPLPVGILDIECKLGCDIDTGDRTDVVLKIPRRYRNVRCGTRTEEV